MAVRSREGYFPVDQGDRSSNIGLLEDNRASSADEHSSFRRGRRASSGSRDSYKPSGFISVWTFSLIILGVAIMFLFGIFIGFYVRELQKGDPDFDKICGTKDKVNEIDYDKIGGYHETLVYYIRGETIKEFVDDFGTEDPVTGSELEKRLADTVLNEFDNYRFDSVEIEEYDVVTTSPDPDRPNQLEVLHHNGSTMHHMVLTNDNIDGGKDDNQPSQDTMTKDWTHPYVVFSPAGVVEASLVYAHYGRTTDFMILQALGVSMENQVALLRMGKLSVADKIRNCELHGAKGVLLYWEPADADADVNAPTNSSDVPFASAAAYSTELPAIWKPSIPCQTISTDHAGILLSLISQKNSSVEAPAFWQGTLTSPYLLGGQDDESYPVRLSVFNIEKNQKVKNIISTIQGISEPDRYVVVGAPRSSLPGQSQDVVASTSILMQLARSFHYVHHLHYWKPKRGVKLVSWGGAEFSNSGMLKHIQETHHLLDRRAVAYFDIRQLALGNESIVAAIPSGLHQLVNEATFDVPDPKNPEQTLQMSWQHFTEDKNLSRGFMNIPIDGYHSDNTQTPFLHLLGVPVVQIQFRAPAGAENSVSAMTREDLNHHYKFHIAVTRILVMSLLSLLDNDVLPFGMVNMARSLRVSIWQTSGVLEKCSDDMENLFPTLSLCSDLIQASEAFEEATDIYVKRSDTAGIRMINDIKMLIERLFISNRNGFPHHIMYPVLYDGSIAEATDFCKAGEIMEVWDHTIFMSSPITVENTSLEEVDAFTYLGSIIDKQGGTEADVKARTAKARTAFNQLSKVWKASNVSLRTKIRLFNSNVKSVLLYGCETWKTTKTVLNKVQTFINRCMRSILKIKWQDKIRNEELWARTGQKEIEVEIGLRRWRWIGHTLRKASGNITRQSLQWNPQGARGRGRPRETWKRSVEREMTDMKLTWSKLGKTAQDRERWNSLVRGLYPVRGERR